MNTQKIAEKLVEHCRSGRWDLAQSELYADNAVSIEPAGGPWPERTEGLKAITEKGQQWGAMVQEVHNMETSDPLVFGNHFSLGMKLDFTTKDGARTKSEEICVYEVKDGKIVKEQFFYPQSS